MGERSAVEQRAFEQLYLKVLGVLLDERLAQGEYEAAITCARQYLATDDLAEEMHCRLIELYAATGDRSAALRQFERCVTALERELGVSPKKFARLRPLANRRISPIRQMIANAM